MSGEEDREVPHVAALMRASAETGSRRLILPVGQISRKPVNPPWQKYLAFPKFGFGVYVARPTHTRGVRVVTKRGLGCGGRGSVGAMR